MNDREISERVIGNVITVSVAWFEGDVAKGYCRDSFIVDDVWWSPEDRGYVVTGNSFGQLHDWVVSRKRMETLCKRGLSAYRKNNVITAVELLPLQRMGTRMVLKLREAVWRKPSL